MKSKTIIAPNGASASDHGDHDSPFHPTAVMASDHPLTLELASLRTSLARFQSLAHTASMRLQGKTMECTLAAESERRAMERCKWLEAEVEVLRRRDAGLQDALAAVPASATDSSVSGDADKPQTSTLQSSSGSAGVALAELTLAHRRLSAKLDALDEHYAAVVERFAAAESDHERRRIEAENLGVLVLDWKDKVESVQGQLEEEKKRNQRLTDAIRAAGVSLSPEDVPLPVDAKHAEDSFTNNDVSSLHACPTCASASTSASSPSALKLSLERAESLRAAAEEQSRDERAARLAAERELARLRADDASASRTVERYMAFTQKTAERLYTSLHDQGARLGATIKTLRAELALERGTLAREQRKSEQLREAVDELAESLERETFGRRREVALRMRQVAREELRADEAASWTDRVRRERNRIPESSATNGFHNRPDASTLSLSLSATSSPLPTPGSLTLSPYASPIKVKPSNGSLPFHADASEPLDGTMSLRRSTGSSNSLASLDAAATPIAASVSPYAQHARISTLWDLLESGVELMSRYDEEPEIPMRKATRGGDGTEDGSPPVDGSLGRVLVAQELAAGLFVDLERETRQRVKLAKERAKSLADGKVEEPLEDDAIEPEQASPLLDTDKTPRVPQVEGFEKSLALDMETSSSSDAAGYAILQRALHDCATSVLRLRALAKADLSAEPRPPTWDAALDALDDVLEDVRVEVEIAAADDARAREAETTVKLVGSEKLAAEVAADQIRRQTRQAAFERKLSDIEHDLVALKMALAARHGPSAEPDSSVTTSDRLGSLRTVRLPLRGGPTPSPPLTGPPTGNGLRRGFLPALGRTFSGTTPSASLAATANNEAAASSMPTLPRYASWSSDLTFETALAGGDDEDERDQVGHDVE